MKKTLLLWLEGSRPKTWIATISPVTIGMVIAWTSPLWDATIYIATFCGALLVQIGTNFANDYLDFAKGADRFRRCSPRRLAQSGLVSIRALKVATCFCFSLAAVLAVYLSWIGGYGIALLGMIAISCGFLYTGGPYPLAYLGLGDLFAFLFFGPIATAGTVYLQIHALSLAAVLAGIAPGLLATALLAANNLRDEKSDRRAAKKTIPVRFGKKVGQIEYFLCLLGAALIPPLIVITTKDHFPVLIASTFLLFAKPALAILFDKKQSANLEPLLPETSKLFAIYTLLFLLTWPLSSS